MQFCQPHWDKLRDAIAAEGLADLVACDGAHAVRQIAAEVEQGKRTLATFDPLMGAHWAIVGRIAEHQPGVVLIDGCPICWVQDGHERTCTDPACGVTRETFEEWIPSVAAFMRTEWERLVSEAA
jgi:hypothetical protein